MNIIKQIHEIHEHLLKAQLLADALGIDTGIKICGISDKIQIYRGMELIEKEAGITGDVEISTLEGRPFIKKTLLIGETTVFTLGDFQKEEITEKNIVFLKASEPEEFGGEE